MSQVANYSFKNAIACYFMIRHFLVILLLNTDGIKKERLLNREKIYHDWNPRYLVGNHRKFFNHF